MREGPGPFGDEGTEPESRRLTPSIGLGPESDVPASDNANEDFLFHLYRGSELLQDNRVHEAKEELEQALHLQPRDAKGQDLLAVVYFRLGLYPRAITIYEQLRRKSPRDSSLLLNLALCYLKTGQPALARRDLEQLLAKIPNHTRAWGYLGLACERLGDLGAAQKAFEQGGHTQMARRMASQRASQQPEPPSDDIKSSQPSREVREVVAAAYEELDAGELSFALAMPATDTRQEPEGNWRSIEIGQMPMPGITRKSSKAPEPDSAKPDTKDGPPPANVPSRDARPIPAPMSNDRRPTLIAPVGVPPMADPTSEIAGLSRFPSPKPPPVSFDDAAAMASSKAPSLQTTIRRPLVVVGPRGMGGASRIPSDEHLSVERTKTLPPPLPRPPTEPPPPAEELTRQSSAPFPQPGNVAMHASGVALVRVAAEIGFAARIESVRASSNALSMRVLERQSKGKTTGESFGGATSPIAHASGEGQLVLGPRPGRKLSSFLLADEMCFVREEVLLGFDGALAYENGRLATGEGEVFAVVQLKGTGAVLLEVTGEVLTLEIEASRGLSARRDVVLGWFGRIVPRALPANEAPCGQRGLVSFVGEGRVLLAGG